MEGTVIHPPPYFDVDAYLGSARALQALQPARLLTAHYDVMEGEQVTRFLSDTVAFVEDAARLTRRELDAAGAITLAELVARVDPALGPFPSMANELGGTLRAHARTLVRDGHAREDPSGLRWYSVNDEGGT
jgi:hypothetical protein